LGISCISGDRDKTLAFGVGLGYFALAFSGSDWLAVTGRDKSATREGSVDPAMKAAFENLAAAVAKQFPTKAALETATAAGLAASAAGLALSARCGADELLPEPCIIEPPTPGRRKGPTPVTAYMVAAFERRLAAAGDGAEWMPIARDIYKALGFRDEKQLKNLADALVRAAKKTRSSAI
jgi:hypothetical protein